MKKLSILIGFILMIILSFAGFALGIAWISIIVSIFLFFIYKKKGEIVNSCYDINSVVELLKYRRIMLLLILPPLINIISIIIAKVFFLEYLTHALLRFENIASLNSVIFLIFELAILALGGELAWRAFFQKQLQKYFPFNRVLVFSSILFALAHIVLGSFAVVIYDFSFVFINSCIFGFAFYKANNIWISAISHFVANLFSAVLLILL